MQREIYISITLCLTPHSLTMFAFTFIVPFFKCYPFPPSVFSSQTQAPIATYSLYCLISQVLFHHLQPSRQSFILLLSSPIILQQQHYIHIWALSPSLQLQATSLLWLGVRRVRHAAVCLLACWVSGMIFALCAKSSLRKLSTQPLSSDTTLQLVIDKAGMSTEPAAPSLPG